jgi:hypothetical protein
LFWAIFAFELSGAVMKIQVLGQIGTLRETFCATGYWALKRFFPSMNSQMIEEVASLSELLATTLILALHYTSDSFSIIMFVPKNFVMGSVGNVFALANSMESLQIL